MLIVKLRHGASLKIGTFAAVRFVGKRPEIDASDGVPVEYGPDAALIGGVILVRLLEEFRVAVDAPSSVPLVRSDAAGVRA